ncbi:MAG: 4Fe-4S cluster-binding domain-containing protein [Christensenellales bacterium]
MFVQGCPHNCPGCHNPQTHDFPAAISPDGRRYRAFGKNPLVRGLTLSGGEPMMRPNRCILSPKRRRKRA